MGNDPLDHTDPNGKSVDDVLNAVDDFFLSNPEFGGPLFSLAGHELGAGFSALGGLFRGAEATKVVERAAITVRAEKGAAREASVAKALKAENPGASVQNQQYLRDSAGKIAKDPVTGEGRRVDHAVIENGSAKTVETTSNNADKTAQAAKEQRILDNGGTNIVGIL